MDSWSYGSEGKGFTLSDEMVSATDAFARSRTVLMGWDLKTPCSYKDTMLAPGREAIEDQGFMELGFPNFIRKPPPANRIGGILGGKVSSGSPSSPTCINTPKEFLGDEESSSRLSSSVVDSNSWDSSLIDLKLGRLADYRDPQNGKSSKEMLVVSSAASSVPEKRARTTNLAFQTPFCQVHGCNMDLSSSKDYHKRHKVCDVHSKTSKVIVNGIEQRFCQQCSRFHLLAEFDDGKRSCRKRLAGHNERRRKPQLDQSGKKGKLLSSYHGSRFLVNSLPARTSFICPDIFSSGILQPDKYETSNWCKRVKLENEAIYRPQSTMPITNEHLFSKSFLPPYGVDKQCPSLHGNGIYTAPGNMFCENSNCYPHELPGPNSVSRSVLWNASSGSEDFTVFDTASTVQGLSGVSDPGCALSLLSSQAQNSSSYSSGISMARPPIIQGDQAHYNLGVLTEKLLGVGSQVSSTGLASYRFSSRINSGEADHLEPLVISDGSNAVNFEVHNNGIFHRPEFLSSKDSLSNEHGTTVDLLQLSSQLQRVEQQRQSLQVKQENDAFCCLHIT